AELGLDLLSDISLVALELLAARRELVSALLALRLERLDPRLERRVGLLPVERVDRGLDRLAFRLERTGQRGFARLNRIRLALERRAGALAGGAFGLDAIEIDDRDDGGRNALGKSGGGHKHGRREGG